MIVLSKFYCLEQVLTMNLLFFDNGGLTRRVNSLELIQALLWVILIVDNTLFLLNVCVANEEKKRFFIRIRLKWKDTWITYFVMLT